jgi:hypothetical protein
MRGARRRYSADRDRRGVRGRRVQTDLSDPLETRRDVAGLAWLSLPSDRKPEATVRVAIVWIWRVRRVAGYADLLGDSGTSRGETCSRQSGNEDSPLR